jgi:class 3 adenylate cyclase
MTHKENFEVVRELLKNNYTFSKGPAIPLKKDLTFDNRYKQVDNAVVVYLDMRQSRKIMFEQNEYKSLKTHRAFLQAFISCVDYHDGRFRSFNGDGALAFFNGELASSRAVKACMDFKRYVYEINNIFDDKGYLNIDYGVGVARGKVYVAKTGRKGSNQTRQDLVWVGYPTYLAVALSDKGRSSYNTWISKSTYTTILEEDKKFKPNLLTEDTNGNSIWREETITMSNGDTKKVYKTSYQFNLSLK